MEVALARGPSSSPAFSRKALPSIASASSERRRKASPGIELRRSLPVHLGVGPKGLA